MEKTDQKVLLGLGEKYSLEMQANPIQGIDWSIQVRPMGIVSVFREIKNNEPITDLSGQTLIFSITGKNRGITTVQFKSKKTWESGMSFPNELTLEITVN